MFFVLFRDDREMMMLEEQAANGNNYVAPFPHHSMFFTHQSSPMHTATGPDRLKLQSYRASPYNYAQAQRKSSPIEGTGFFLLLSSVSCVFIDSFQTVKHDTIFSSKKIALSH